MSSDASRIRAAADRYGHLVDHIAGRYTNPVTGKRLSGAALLLKIAQGESSALTSDKARTDVSSAGARAWMQFMPSSRAVAIQKYGVDPWRTPEEAVRAATLHLRGKINGQTGLEGYNPGSSTYPSYILGQRVGATHEASGSGGAPASSAAPRTTTSSSSSSAAASSMPAFDVVSAPEAVQAPVVQASPLTAPKFSAGPTMPAGYQAPVSGGGPVAQEKPAEDSPDAWDALPTEAPGVTVAAPDKADVPAAPRGGGSAGGGAVSDSKYPLRKRGSVIGTPYSGTHNLGNWQSDNALDLGVPNGTIVTSAREGVVEKVGGSYSGGSCGGRSGCSAGRPAARADVPRTRRGSPRPISTTGRGP